MTDSLPAPPEIDPAALAASEFTRTRRGLESTEVRAALGRAADALRTWSERDSRLRDRILELEERLDESHELDESRIATVLGEETARIVTAARDAAAEIRTKAEEQAERLIRESEATATADAQRLRGEAQVLRDDAARVAAAADVAATELRETTARETERARADAQAAAATMREEAAALATSTVSDAQSRADDLLAAAELVLSERTNEATEAAAEISAAAARHAEAEMAAATELRETAEAEVAALRAEAEAEVAALRAEIDAEVAAMRAEAEADASTTRSEAEQVAAATIEEATDRGRSMVAEARAVRERMLRDLAERRRIARRQLEGALAGRDRIAEVLRAAGEEVGATIAGLDEADHSAAIAADAAAATIDDDLDAELVALQDALQDDDHDGIDDGMDGGAVELEGPGRNGAHDAAPGPDEPTAAEDAADELASPPEGLPGPTGESGAEDGSPEGGATVHDLFARIRAEGVDDEAPEGAEPDAEGVADDAAEDPGHDAEAVVAVPAGSAADSSDDGDDVESIDLTESDSGTQSDSGTATTQEGPTSADRVFDRRDELLLPVEKSLARGLKRLASDEQNEMLDKLRRVKRGRPDPAAILPSSDPTSFVESLLAEFTRAVTAGAEFWSELAGAPGPAVVEDDPEVRGALEYRVTEFLALHRAHLERAFAEADEAGLETPELADRVRATYRDWRSGSLSDLAGDLATAGFALGEQRAAGPDSRWCWVVDHGGLPCADGEDNALAGEVACGEAFPTGDVTPPAHPGCRCILAPAHS